MCAEMTTPVPACESTNERDISSLILYLLSIVPIVFLNAAYVEAAALVAEMSEDKRSLLYGLSFACTIVPLARKRSLAPFILVFQLLFTMSAIGAFGADAEDASTSLFLYLANWFAQVG